MSASIEIKRVSLSSSADLFTKKSEKETNGTSGKRKATKSTRIQLKLDEPTFDNFPEFDFNKLIYIEKKKQKKLSKVPNGVPPITDDPLAENDDDEVARIAREMEAKYGNDSSYGKKYTSKSDYDRGAGYDESDSFIDNTEAYDELIPDEIETDRGGFYINSGALEFKKMSNFERPGDEIKMPKPRKRILSSSSEEEDDEESLTSETEADTDAPAQPKKKKSNPENKKQKKDLTPAASSSDEQGKSKKAAKKDNNKDVEREKEKTTKEPEKEKQKTKEPEREDKIKDPEKLKKPEKLEESKTIKTTTVKDMLRAKRDQELKKMEREGKGATTTEDDTEHESSSEVLDSSDEVEKQDTTENGVVQKEVKMPDNLPESLQKRLQTIKQKIEEYRAESSTSNKQSFFDSSVNDILLKIDVESRKCGNNVKTQVYGYLQKIVPCSRNTFVSKIKKMKVHIEDNKAKLELNKLKSHVDDMMPSVIAKYESDCAHVINVRKISTIVGSDDNQKNTKMPRKKFPWNENLRNILAELVSIRQEVFKILKPRKETVDDFLIKYLNDVVIPVWPQGWIKHEDLIKELDRRKKKEQTQSSTSTISISSSNSNLNANNSSTAGSSIASSVPATKTAKPDKEKESSSKSVLHVNTSNQTASTQKQSTQQQPSQSKQKHETQLLKPHNNSHQNKSPQQSSQKTNPSHHNATQKEKTSSIPKEKSPSAAATQSQPQNLQTTKLQNPVALVHKDKDKEREREKEPSKPPTETPINFAKKSDSGKEEKIEKSYPDVNKMAAINRIHNKGNASSDGLKSPQSSNSGRKSSDHSISSIISLPAERGRPSDGSAYNQNDVIDLENSPVKTSNHISHSQKPFSSLILGGMSSGVSNPSSYQSEDSDSDCVEIVGEFYQSPVKKQVVKEKHKLPVNNAHSHKNVNNNNNVLNDAPPPKKKKHSDESASREDEIDVQKIMMDLQQLQGYQPQQSSKLPNSASTLSSAAPSIPQPTQIKQQGNLISSKSDVTTDYKSANGSKCSNNNNVHYSIKDILTSNSRTNSNSNSFDKNSTKSCDSAHKSNVHNQHLSTHQQNQHNFQSTPISLRKSPMAPVANSANLAQHKNNNSSSYMIPSILNLSTGKHK